MDVSPIEGNKLLFRLLIIMQWVGVIIYLLPKAVIPAYSLMLIGVVLALLFVIIQLVRRNQGTTWEKFKNIWSQASPVVPLILILSSLIVVFTLQQSMSHCKSPTKEFLTYKWISYSFIAIELYVLYKYLMRELPGAKAKIQEGKTGVWTIF